ncbi:MAG: hypothetical protein ISQ41_06185 [Flavobacteriaceae bacterium]|nr:hypothetical protein [Flavobacteriaceae bacterium]MBL6685037.1 hypothetical protein [Flavobacteriaceae bacterium]
MKKILFLFLISSLYLSSQTVQKVEVIKSDDQINKLFNEIGNNELKVDLLDLIANTSIDVTYEKINDPYSSYGASIYLNLSGDNTSSNWSDLFSLTPYYRFYFFNKRDYGGAGFFAEIFSKFSSMKYDLEYFNYNSNPDQPGTDYWTYDEEKEFTIALGASIGQKWINKKGWTFEINFGEGT